VLRGLRIRLKTGPPCVNVLSAGAGYGGSELQAGMANQCGGGLADQIACDNRPDDGGTRSKSEQTGPGASPVKFLSPSQPARMVFLVLNPPHMPPS
jgi:hypothetical protein